MLKFSIFSIALVACLSCNNTPKVEVNNNPPILGKAFDTTKTIGIDEMANQVLAGKEYNGTIEGTIEKVCQKAGCWADVKLSSGEMVKVLFRDSTNNEFTIDINSVGKKLIAHGIGFTDTTSIEQLQHFAKDGNKTEEEIKAINAPKIGVGFTADGALVK